MPADQIISFSTYVKGAPDDPGVEFSPAFGTYNDYLAAGIYAYQGIRELPIIVPDAMGTAIPEVNCGRWVWQCPACHTGMAIDADHLTLCYGCGNGQWHNLHFPDNKAEIEAELLRQPGRRMFAPVRNWEPGWTIEDLRDRTRLANLLIAQGVKLVRALSIGTTRIWMDGETLSGTNMNLYGSDLYSDLIGRNGVIELENSLTILSGASGSRYFGLPGGSTAQRTSSPAAGILRWNTTTVQIDGHDGSQWIRLLDSRDL